MKWLISVPLWGAAYEQKYYSSGLPSIRAAMAHAGLDVSSVRFLVHPDPPGGSNTLKLGNACRIGLASAAPDEAVMFYNADMVISKETFDVCEKRFARGNLFVTAHSVRVRDTTSPPIDVAARDLLTWGWDHRHRWVDDCIYGYGSVAGPAIVAFPSPTGVVAHCFSMQCLAVRHMPTPFTGPTCDELIDCFSRDEVAIITNRELAIVEPCSPDLAYDRRKGLLTAEFITSFAEGWASRMMCWQFGHQVLISGEPNPMAQHIADAIISRVDQSVHPARLLPYTNQRVQAAHDYNVRRAPLSARALLGRVPRPIRAMVPDALRRAVLRWI